MSSIETIVDQLSSLTITQALELSQVLEEKWGVSAAAPVVVANDASSQGGGAPAVDEKTSFDVVLLGFEASSKISVIKSVREITSLGLKESKELVEGFPKNIKEGVDKDEAEGIKAKLVSAGAKIELR
ncbi:MAG: 50S ribosomal protein L7/L12 [Candidatus Liberibacter europaeus]|uniref:Large ribosomal subunit protein bL12 n=1 Tax=Candidatus Liberibacter europaeus TaxID=744859 RepID=A0A2T4VY73_9HYPH|nr:50S ribosomal protein L7/L12 [Candidatus Liberibacter europaeus]PTL86729.1 MAG: 50S ribosomal protein L7/L12 [Candidatus Liberibacter europaeus]